MSVHAKNFARRGVAALNPAGTFLPASQRRASSLNRTSYIVHRKCLDSRLILCSNTPVVFLYYFFSVLAPAGVAHLAGAFFQGEKSCVDIRTRTQLQNALLAPALPSPAQRAL